MSLLKILPLMSINTGYVVQWGAIPLAEVMQGSPLLYPPPTPEVHFPRVLSLQTLYRQALGSQGSITVLLQNK